MSFTDAMYEAMREFYFRGTPYPAHVGVDTPAESKRSPDEITTAPPEVTKLGKTTESDTTKMKPIPEHPITSSSVPDDGPDGGPPCGAAVL